MKKLTKEEFIAKAKAVHGDKYDYSHVKYNGCRQKVVIICPKHGTFWQLPNCHANGQGCPKCFNEIRSAIRRLTLDEFTQKTNIVHNCKYDYSKVQYINSQSPIKIICPTHGLFMQRPASHLHGQGCPKCHAMKISQAKTKTQADFIRDARKVHGAKYDYSKVVYKGSYEKVCIICPSGHEFWQAPYCHISGQGCPVCLESNGEQTIRQALTKVGIDFEAQKKFPKWMGKQSLDFYLPKLQIGIEHQGKQHYTPVKQWGNFQRTHDKDIHKQLLCAKHGITVLYLATSDVFKYPRENWEWMLPYLFTTIDQLIGYIRNIK